MSDSARPRMLVDAHQHVWDLNRHAQTWLDEPGHAPINRTFTTADLRSAATRSIAGRTLTGTVVVQSIPSVAETLDLLELAQADDLVQAVVGWVDLASPEVGDQLDQLRCARGGSRLRSLRALVQGETDPEWLQQPSVERGLRAVAQRGLGYDILIRSHQFPQAIALAERFPDLASVLDHAGKPPIADGDLDAWTRHVRRLAAHPNVMCKVSGLITEADHEHWTIAQIRPVWEVLLDAFGPARLMFGSDWPVCVLAGSWDRWAETVEQLLGPLTEDEVEAVTAGTASAFYQLPAPGPTR